jgi:probable F420-dependent oxidoreductase
MKIRVGISLGAAARPAELAAAVQRLEDAGVDSLWLSEVLHGPLAEPFIGMTYALARTARLKVGTGVAVLPGRHPVLVAKQLATLAGLAPGRVLPVFGLRPARPAEVAAFVVPAGRRAAVFDESMQLLRRLLTEDSVSFDGEFFSVSGVSIGPRPAKPLDIWLGGSAPAAMRRVGRFGDGWLGSFLTPAEARAGREAIQQAAAQAGREVDPEHFGFSLAVGGGHIPAELARAVQQRRPGLDPEQVAAAGWPQARELIEGYIEAGLSKFVVRPADPMTPIERFTEEFAAELMPMQT